jgi:hypothetical protein
MALADEHATDGPPGTVPAAVDCGDPHGDG